MRNEQQDGPAALLALACRLGAGDAALIRAADIVVEAQLAKLCETPRCENYGLGAGCPPHVSGPSGFQELLKDFEQAVVFKIEVPSESLFSSERRDIFRLLHEIAAAIEQSAVREGYRHARAYAGGSCKAIFCRDQPNCRVVGEGGQCRHPDHARPSMSGFGINVARLMKAAGWTMNRAASGNAPNRTSIATVCGLVLLG